MHQNHARAVFGRDATNFWVFLAPAHIVHNICASIKSRRSDLTERGVHADWNCVVLTKRANDRLNAKNLLSGRNARGAGARAFTTNVKYVSAMIDHALAMRNGLLGGGELATVRKRIWCAIENARKQGPRCE